MIDFRNGPVGPSRRRRSGDRGWPSTGRSVPPGHRWFSAGVRDRTRRTEHSGTAGQSPCGAALGREHRRLAPIQARRAAGVLRRSLDVGPGLVTGWDASRLATRRRSRARGGRRRRVIAAGRGDRSRPASRPTGVAGPACRHRSDRPGMTCVPRRGTGPGVTRQPRGRASWTAIQAASRSVMAIADRRGPGPVTREVEGRVLCRRATRGCGPPLTRRVDRAAGGGMGRTAQDGLLGRVGQPPQGHVARRQDDWCQGALAHRRAHASTDESPAARAAA
jgi:hypothetical protein